MDLKIREYLYSMQNYQGFHLRPILALKSKYRQLFSEKNKNIGVQISPTVPIMFILIFLAVTGLFIVIGCFAILVIISLVLYMIRICRGDEETDTPPHGHKSYYNCSETVLVQQQRLPRMASTAFTNFKTNLTVPR